MKVSKAEAAEKNVNETSEKEVNKTAENPAPEVRLIQKRPAQSVKGKFLIWYILIQTTFFHLICFFKRLL